MTAAHAAGTDPGAGRADATRKVTDARAMRALAHPVRIALLEALAHAGTLTATQASQILGESPANCAFHLRTLAKYGYVEEAGGGRGRERPWRRVHQPVLITSEQDDPQSALAADEIGQFMLETVLDRARTALSRHASWPPEWHHTGLGQAQHTLYLTPQEARQVTEETDEILDRYYGRLDHPERRPPGAMPVEIVKLSYLLMHLTGRPGPGPGAEAVTKPGEPKGALG